MAEISFKPEHFFDVGSFSYPQLFDGLEHVWDAMPRLSEFIEAQFKEGKLKANYKDRKDVYIGDGTVIEEGVFIKGPAIVGKNSFLAQGVYLREGVILGDNVHIGHACELKHSIVFSKTAVAHLSYMGDSIIGANVNIGGGATTANFRFDGKPIRIKNGDKHIDTGFPKLGAIIGDGSKIGVNAVLNPGTILGKGCIIYPLVSVVGVHDADETIT